MQRSKVGNILARTRANKVISSLYGKEAKKHNERVLEKLKEDMARVRAKLNDPKTALSHPGARRQTAADLKQEFIQLRKSYALLNAEINGANWENIIKTIESLGVKRHILQIDRLDMIKEQMVEQYDLLQVQETGKHLVIKISSTIWK